MIRILLGDDHKVVRQGLKEILKEMGHAEIFFEEAGSAAEILQKVSQASWDILILDISLPDKNGLNVLKDVKQHAPHLPVLILSIYSEEQYALRMLKAGAAGYLTKDSAAEELVHAVAHVLGGKKYVSSHLAEKLAVALDRTSTHEIHDALSDREFEVLCLIGEGRTITEISEKLLLSVKTVSTYRARILEKMQMTTTAELIRYVVEKNLSPTA